MDDSPTPDIGGGEFDSLLNRFSSLHVATSRDELTQQFANVVGLSIELSRFYLEAAGWVLETAINLYLDSSGMGGGGPRGAAPLTTAQSQPPPTGPRSGAEETEETMLRFAIEASMAGSSSAVFASGDSMGDGLSDFEDAPPQQQGGSNTSGGMYGGMLPPQAPPPTVFGGGSGAPVFAFTPPPPSMAFGAGAAPPAFSFGTSAASGFASTTTAAAPTVAFGSASWPIPPPQPAPGSGMSE
jgi:hypothetical protein